MRNITDELRSSLGSNRAEIVQQIAKACKALRCTAYIVGGSVRDALLGLPTTDLDISIVSPSSNSPCQIAESLGANVIKTSQFGTIKIELYGMIIDFVSARSERYKSPGSLPEVTISTLNDDLARRDFTINSMAVSLDHYEWGNLIDPHKGRQDLVRNIVRTLHQESFQDDPTRILRAARYTSRFGFSLDQSTKAELLRSTEYLDLISPARFKQELEHVFSEPNSLIAMNHLSDWGALDLPLKAFSFDRRAWGYFGDRNTIIPSEKRLIGWALISLGFDTPQTLQILERWGLDYDSSNAVSETLKLRHQLAHLTLPELSISNQVAFLEQFDIHTVKALSLSESEPNTRRALINYVQNLVNIQPISSGHDIIALGVTNGPLVGKVLQILKNARLDGNVNSLSEETALIKAFVSKLAE